MKTSKKLSGILGGLGILAMASIFIFSGCATKEYVGEQITPVADRVTRTEGKLVETDGKITKLEERATADESKITKIEGDLGKADSKAEKALAAFGNLKFERRLTLAVDMKEGANFKSNSSKLSDEAKQKIDEFIGSQMNNSSAVFLVAGHTDNKGSDNANYELGKRRADMVSRYLITQKKIDPLHVVTASYGETTPITDNKTREDRAKNRRVEILVYNEAIANVGQK